jgi:hypothetical protein
MTWFAGRRRRLSGPRVRQGAARLAAIVLIGLFVYIALSVIQVLSASRASQEPYAVARTTFIVVMGEHDAAAAISTDTEARLAQAMSLYGAGSGKKIVIGILPASAPPSGMSSTPVDRFLTDQGLPAADLAVVEATSDDSLLARVGDLAVKGLSRNVIVVSDPLDNLRLRGDAASYGLLPQMSPATPSGSGVLGDGLTIGQQALAVAVGRVFGFSTTGWASS